MLGRGVRVGYRRFFYSGAQEREDRQESSGSDVHGELFSA